MFNILAIILLNYHASVILVNIASISRDMPDDDDGGGAEDGAEDGDDVVIMN